MKAKNVLQAIQQGRIPAMGDIPDPLLNLAARAVHWKGRVAELNSVERVLCAFQHKEPDRVPVTPILNAGARHITGTSFPEYSQDPQKAADVLMAGFDLVGGDFLVLLLDLAVEAEGFGQKVIYPLNSTAHPDYNDPLIKDEDGYEKLRPARLADSRRMTDFVRLCEILVGRVGFRALVAGFVFGPLGVLSMMRGAASVFKDCMSHPKKVTAACAAITETLLEFVQAQCDAGVGAVAIDSLFASASGVPKKTWEEIEGPFCREIADLIRKNGKAVGIHNCGHGIYFDAQIRSMEPQVISFAHLPDDCATPREMKQRYGDSLTLLGYVPTPVLVHGTPAQVMEECRRQIDILAPGGGFILAPGCEYPPNIPITNAFAMVRAAQLYG